MKKTILLLPLCLAMVCGLPACSKAKKTGVLAKPQAVQVAGTAAADDPVSIRLKWIPGDRYVFRAETVVGVETVTPDSSDPKEFALALGQECSITPGPKLADGGQELNLEITAQRYFYQFDARNYFTYDSLQSAAEDAADPISPLLRQLIGVPIKCHADADGKLTQAVGIDAVTSRWNLKNQPVIATLQGIFSEQTLRTAFNLAAAAQPADSMKIGQSWPMLFKLETGAAANLALKAQLRLADWDRRGNRECLRIELKGDVAAQPGANGETGATKIEDGTITGTAWFDPQLGTLLHAAITGHINAKTVVLGQGVSTRFNFTSNFRLTGVEEP